MGRRTPLYYEHIEAEAKMVEFAGWDMPLHYGSQLEEHRAVRAGAGMFDVSHMVIVDVRGSLAQDFLRRMLANDVARLRQPGKALYTCMLNERGGVVDDLIAHFVKPDWYRLVFNAGARERDLAWLDDNGPSKGLEIQQREGMAMIAVQGPLGRAKAHEALGEGALTVAGLAPFFGADIGELFISRTGYTGEDGYEIMVPADEARVLWERLLLSGVAPCGLGARDTLRLEAGLNLCGQDMDENVTPLECGLAWTVAWEPKEREFLGREALEAQRREGLCRERVGLVLEGRGVLRRHYPVMLGTQTLGAITSGSYSPTLARSIALALVRPGLGDVCQVDVRGSRRRARVVRPPFVRNGKVLV